MSRLNRIALAVSGAWAIAACTTVQAPEQRSVLPERAGTVQPVMTVRNSGGVDAEGYYRVGRQDQGQARYRDAIVWYRKALALDPKHVEALNALGVAHSLLGEAGEAERAFQAAIGVSPGSSHLHSNLGFHYLQVGRFADARDALREAVRLNAANAMAWSHLAQAEEQMLPAASVAQSKQPDPTPVAAPAAVGDGPKLPEEVAAVPSVLPAPASPVAATVVTAVVQAPATTLQAVRVAPAVEATETPQVMPSARLVGIAPNVWQLRPREVEVILPIAADVPTVVPVPEAQSASALSPRVRFEIANGNGVTGLARGVGAYFRTLGLAKPRLTNQVPFDQRRTEIQYVAGMQEQAHALKAVLATPVELMPKQRLERGVEVRLVLGRDFHETETVARLRREIVKPVLLARGAGRS